MVHSHPDSTIENDNPGEEHASAMPLHHETTTSSSSSKRQTVSSKSRSSRRATSPSRNGNEEQRSSNRKLVEEALDQSLSQLESLESVQAAPTKVPRQSTTEKTPMRLGDHLERSVSRTKSNSSSNSSVRSGDSALSRRRQLRKKLKEACREQWEKQHSDTASRDARSVASESASVVSSSSTASGTRTRRRAKKPSDDDDSSSRSSSSTRIRVRRSTAPSVQQGEDGEKKARPSPHVRRRKRHGPADTAPVTPRRAPSNDPSPARLGGETPTEEETFVPSRVQRSHSDSTSDRTMMLRTSDHSDDSNEEESRPMAQPVVQPLDWDKIEPKKGSSSTINNNNNKAKEQPRRRFPALGRTFSLGARKSASFNSKDDASVYSGAGRTVSSHSTASTASMSQSDSSTLSGDSSQGDASISSKSSVALNRGLSLKNFTNLVDRIKSDVAQNDSSNDTVPPPPPAEGRSTPGSQGSKSRKSPRGRNMETNRAARRSRSKSVVFGSVTVREYERSVGDNPAVSSGTPISLGWDYIHLLDVAVDIYEATVRKPGPRSRKDFFLTPHQRFHLLMDEWEHSVHDIINAKNLATEIRYQRHVSIFGEPKQQQQQQQLQQQQQQQQTSKFAAPSKGSSSSGSSNLVKRATRGGAYPKNMSKKLPKLPKGESRWDSYPTTTTTAVGVQQ
eukprot:Nitzschia sp. Nitz4//scaffold101_size76361//60999//63026//NITZ4_005611-RA/size76361-processed-gene-0.22-mRNA-1//1//CDS//3329532185//1885//frame0